MVLLCCLDRRGYRALGFGLAEGSGSPDAPGTHWEFLGLLPLFDPPRHDTAETIKRCQHMGIGGARLRARALCSKHPVAGTPVCVCGRQPASTCWPLRKRRVLH